MGVEVITARPPFPPSPCWAAAALGAPQPRRCPVENLALPRSEAKGPARPSVPPAGCGQPLGGSVPTHAFLV